MRFVPAGFGFLLRRGEDCSSTSALRPRLWSALSAVCAGELPGVSAIRVIGGGAAGATCSGGDGAMQV